MSRPTISYSVIGIGGFLEWASTNAVVGFELMKRFLGWIFSGRGLVTLLIVAFFAIESMRASRSIKSTT
jgi:hypothetical protein